MKTTLGTKLGWLPILCDLSCGRPGEGVVVCAVSHVDADSADGHTDPIRLVVDGDGAEVGVQFVFEHPLRANQLTVHHDTFRTSVLPTQQTQDHMVPGHKMLTPHV